MHGFIADFRMFLHKADEHGGVIAEARAAQAGAGEVSQRVFARVPGRVGQ